MVNVKNYTEQGGDKTIIGGEIIIKGKMTVSDGAEVSGVKSDIPIASASTLGGVKIGSGLAVTAAGEISTTPAAAQSDSEAEALETLVSDFNSLLSKLRNAGIIAST